MSNEDPRNSSEAFFTVVPSRAGFTDQLTQFVSLYLLGSKLGLNFYHTRIKSNRSTFTPLISNKSTLSKIHRRIQKAIRTLRRTIPFAAKIDVFDYIGFNEYFFEISKPLNMDITEKVYIDLSNEKLRLNNITTLSELEKFIKSVSCTGKGKKTLFVFYIKRGRKVINLISSDIPMNMLSENLKNKYLSLRHKQKWKYNSDLEGLNILVHIRQGDTSLIKTPWNTYIHVFALYHYVEGEFAELLNLSKLNNNHNITVNEYYSFLVNVFAKINQSNMSVNIFSDGFKRGFSRIYQHIHKLNFSESQKELIKKSEKNYDYNAFKIFRNLRKSRLFIGEDNKKLFKLIHSVFQSDIIIIGTHQAMIPKMLSVYFAETDIPLVIVLYKGKMPIYQYISREIIDKKFIFFDINNPDFDRIESRVNNYIISK